MDTSLMRSPYGLIQEELRREPWRLLVACTMLNLTSIVQVRPVISRFFELYPTPEVASRADPTELAALIKPLGLHNRRARSIIRLSEAFMGSWSDVDDLPGVGKYAADSYRIFVQGTLDVIPKDAKLIKYVEWARGNRG